MAVYENNDLTVPEKISKKAIQFAEHENVDVVKINDWVQFYYKKGENKIAAIIKYLKNDQTQIAQNTIDEFYADSIRFRNGCYKIVMFIEELFVAFLSFDYPDLYDNYVDNKTTMGSLFPKKNNKLKKKVITAYFAYLGVPLVNNDLAKQANAIYDNYVYIRNWTCHPKFINALKDGFTTKMISLKYLMFAEAWTTNLNEMLVNQKLAFFKELIGEL